MAKKPAKETSLPVICALVFFVLTTIAFGVLWYTQYSEQQAKDAAVADARKKETAANALKDEAELQVKVLRVLIGIDEEKDKENIASQTKMKQNVDTYVKKFNDAMAKAAGVDDASKLPEELKIWPLDEKGAATEPPAKGFLPIIGDAIAKRNAANDASATAIKKYKEAVDDIKKSIDDFAELKKSFDLVMKAIPDDNKKKLAAMAKAFDDRKNQFSQVEAKSRDELSKIDDEKGKAERERNRLAEVLKETQKELDSTMKQLVKKQDTFQYDEPQGKILSRLSDDVVEINLGSDVLVRPGLTFTVLPSDYPEKGRQSRMKTIRMPNEKGEYKSVERFTPKATLEVISVIGPKTSRARITSEYSQIRDAVGPGDLLYNATWRKGTADHIALIGLFDMNGDGSDDILTVVRDLQKMGIPVDAYYDMKTRKWVGTIDPQTRYIVQGYSPLIDRANDPKLNEKSKLITDISDALKFAQSKGGAQIVNFRDFFPRMGYRVKLDVSPDKVNQAAATYLQGVGVVETPPEKQ